MAVAGIICEYNPFHRGHRYQFAALREKLGAETPVVCALSGDVVQRGDFAVCSKEGRALAAVECGADLVLELPPGAALTGARQFARAGVSLLAGTGVVSHLVFGSESGDLEALEALAGLERMPGFDGLLREEMARGLSYAAARQAAARRLLGEAGELLSSPNDILGVEYLRALEDLGARLTPLALKRQGPGHHDGEVRGEFVSASALRQGLLAGETSRMLPLLPPPMARELGRELAEGSAPVTLENSRGAVLFHLRRLGPDHFSRLPDCGEDLARRMARSARSARSVEEFVRDSRSRRVPEARVRRALLWSYLGLRERERPVPFLRVLAIGKNGRELLRGIGRRGALPVLTKPAQVRGLGAECRTVFDEISRAADLRSLAWPGRAPLPGGSEWKKSPVVLEKRGKSVVK